MPKVHLVAVEHANNGDLIAPTIYQLIEDKVIPLLHKQCVLVVEGGKNRGRMTSADPGYDVIYRQLGPITTTGIRPLIHSNDPRMDTSSKLDILDWLRKSDEFPQILNKSIIVQNVPKTWDELVERIKSKKHSIHLRSELPEEWNDFARDLRRRFTLADQAFVSQIRRYERMNKDVLFFGGLLHCLVLTAENGWPVLRYECSERQISGFYQAWYQAYGLAEFLEKQKP